MQLTRDTVAHKLEAYLHHQLSLDDLVAWANAAMMEGEFEEEHFTAVRDTVARLGLADVQAFGLAWEDCEKMLKQIGYHARVEIVAA
jgi:cobyrinic acid a,c-diamide synthase